MLIKIILLFLFFCISLSSEAFVFETNTNLIFNSGFEKKPTGNNFTNWYVSDTACCAISSEAHSGSYSMQLESMTGDKNKWVSSEFVKIKSNANIHVSAWLKIEDVTIGKNLWNKAVAGVFFFDNLKRSIHRIDLVRDAGSRDWSKYEKNIIVPHDAEYLKVKFYFSDSSGMVWIDDVSVYEIPRHVGKRISVAPGNDLIELTVDNNTDLGPVGNINGIVYESSKNKFTGVEKLNPSIIRTPSIISHHYPLVKVDKFGHVRYSWDKLDSDIEAIVALNAVPFVSIGWVPEIFEEEIREKKYTNWSAFIYTLVSRYSSKYDVSSWYWNFWNEPAAFRDYGSKRNHINWFGSEEDFYDFYKITVEAAVKANENVKIGAAGFASNSPWLFDFIKWVGEKKIRLNHISWHSYGEVPEDISNKIRSVKKLLSNYKSISNAEIIIDEWSSYVHGDVTKEIESGKNSYAAAYRISSIIEMIDAGVDANIWFNMYEKKYGVFYNDKKQPVYHSFRFVNELRGVLKQIEGDESDPYINAISGALSSELTVLISYLHHPLDTTSQYKKTIVLIFNNMDYSEYMFEKSVVGLKGVSGEIIPVDKLKPLSNKIVAGDGTGDSLKVEFVIEPNTIVMIKALAK